MSRPPSFISKSRTYKFTTKENAMTTVQPEGEEIRKAVKWISDERQYGADKTLIKLIEEAGLKFNLSPLDQEYLINFFRKSDS